MLGCDLVSSRWISRIRRPFTITRWKLRRLLSISMSFSFKNPGLSSLPGTVLRIGQGPCHTGSHRVELRCQIDNRQLHICAISVRFSGTHLPRWIWWPGALHPFIAVARWTESNTDDVYRQSSSTSSPSPARVLWVAPRNIWFHFALMSMISSWRKLNMSRITPRFTVKPA